MYGMGTNAFLTHISNVAVEQGFSVEQAALLPSVFGIAGLVGRIVILLFIHVLRLSVINVFIIYFSLMGLLIIVYGFLSNLYLMFACCAGIGFFFSVEATEPI